MTLPHHTPIAVIGSTSQDAHLAKVGRLMHWLCHSGAELAVEPLFADYLQARMSHLPIPRLVDFSTFHPRLVISLGGDGTFLRAAAWLGHVDTPILGINTGHLGYLTAVSIDDAQPMIEAVLSGDFIVERRALIEVRSPLLVDNGVWPFALNEVAVLKEDTASMIEVKARLDGVDLATYHADGLLVATPTGSTAYNLSVGGPIIEPLAPNWAVTPIAAHTLTQRPLVLGDQSVMTLTTTSRAAGYRVSVDGRSATLPSGSTLTLRRADYTIGVVQPRGHSFAATLSNKLLWGLN